MGQKEIKKKGKEKVRFLGRRLDAKAAYSTRSQIKMLFMGAKEEIFGNLKKGRRVSVLSGGNRLNDPFGGALRP